MTLVQRVPAGFRQVQYAGKTYSLTREDFAQGRSSKIFARELGGTDYISFNEFFTKDGIQV